MNKQIDYDYMIAKRDFDESKFNAPVEKQSEIVKQSSDLKQTIESKKIAPQREVVIKKQTQQYPQDLKSKEHEGIFRNF
jgi:hypothetical protein